MRIGLICSLAAFGMLATPAEACRNPESRITSVFQEAPAAPEGAYALSGHLVFEGAAFEGAKLEAPQTLSDRPDPIEILALMEFPDRAAVALFAEAFESTCDDTTYDRYADVWVVVRLDPMLGKSGVRLLARERSGRWIDR
jgi:hypothetical protein